MIASIYSNDWFGRSESDYTFNEKEAMKGIVKLPNHKYSSFLYTEDRAERICSDKKLLHKEIIGMINALGLTNITVKLSDINPTASTDGKFIEIGMGDEYKSISDCYEKIDRVIGMAIHESCHCLYTDFNYMRSVCGSNPKLVHHIHKSGRSSLPEINANPYGVVIAEICAEKLVNPLTATLYGHRCRYEFLSVCLTLIDSH